MADVVEALVDALAELEAAERAGPARPEVLELVVEVRKQHKRKVLYEPAAVAERLSSRIEV